jgi:hypothetical protein
MRLSSPIGGVTNYTIKNPPRPVKFETPAPGPGNNCGEIPLYGVKLQSRFGIIHFLAASSAAIQTSFKADAE